MLFFKTPRTAAVFLPTNTSNKSYSALLLPPLPFHSTAPQGQGNEQCSDVTSLCREQLASDITHTQNAIHKKWMQIHLCNSIWPLNNACGGSESGKSMI